MSTLRLSSALMAVMLSFLLSVIPAYAENAAWSEEGKPLAFNDVNELLHKNYAHAKDEIRQSLGPIILCTNDSVSLLKGNSKTTVPFIRPHYTGLKQIAHITLGTFILLTNHTDENLSAEEIKRLQEYKGGIEKATLGLEKNQGLEPGDDSRQQEIIKKTVAFLSTVINEKRVSHSDLKEYVRACAVPDLDNAYEAAGSQITTMDDAIVKWHSEMTPEEWKKLHVIIWTAHMPRQELLAYQYFSKLLNQPQEGEQLIVAESPSPCNEEQAIDLLLTHILDGKVAVGFFNDPWRMHRDLLSDGARQWLERHDLKGNLASK